MHQNAKDVTGKIATSLHKQKKFIAIAVAALVFLAMVAGLYALSPESGSNAETIVVKVVDTVYSQLNPFRTNAPKNEFVTEYDFVLSAADLNYFEAASLDSVEAGYKTEFASDYRKVKMEHDGKKYDVKMALFGDGGSHYMWNKKSFQIKADTEELIENKRRLDFVLPLEREYIGMLYAEYVAGKLGLFTPKAEIALVRFNGHPRGLYVVSEEWDEYLMERNQQPGMVILKRSENWMQDHPNDAVDGITFDTGHITPFDLEISNFAGIDSEFESEIMYKARQMLDAIESGDQSQFENIFDLEQVAKIEAYIAIRGERHDFIGDNTRFFYDTTSGKFGLVPRSEGGLESLALPGYGGIERQISTSRDQPELTSRYILRNPELRNRRNEIIWQLLQEKDELVSKYEELEQKYMPVFLADSTDSVRSSKTAYYVRINKEHLKQNIELLEKQFSYGKAYINIIQKQNTITIEIIPDSTTALKTGNFSIKLNPGTNTTVEATAFDQNGKQIAQETVQITDGTIELSRLINKNLLQAGLDEEMQPKVATFTYELAFQNNVDIISVEISAQNAITGKILPQNDIYTAIAKDGEGLE